MDPQHGRAGGAQQPTGQSARRRINLTYGDLDNLFKDLSRTQQKTLNKSNVVLQGTKLQQPQGPESSFDYSINQVGRRRVQSGVPTTKNRAQQHRFRVGETLSKRSSMLFNQTQGSNRVPKASNYV